MRRLLILPLLAACSGSEPAAPKGDPHWMAKVKQWYCASEALKAPNLVPSAPRPAPAAPPVAPPTSSGTPPAPGTAENATAAPSPATPAAPATAVDPKSPPTAPAAPAPSTPEAPKAPANALPEPTARSIALKFTGKEESLYGVYAIWGGARDRVIGKLTRFERQGLRVGKLLWETDKRQKGDVTLTFAEDFGTVTVTWTGDPAGHPMSTSFTASDAQSCPAAALIR